MNKQLPPLRFRTAVQAGFGMLLLVLVCRALDTHAAGPEAPRTQVKTLKVTVLSTMLADSGFGEWGFAALVEGDGHRVLVDTGAHPDTVLRNMQELHVDLSDVKEVVLTHHHWDHVRGLMTLRREMKKDYEGTGGRFVEHDGPSEIFPGAWLSGPVPRKYPERNWSGAGRVNTPDGIV